MRAPLIFACVLCLTIIGGSFAELSKKGNDCLKKFKTAFPITEQIKTDCMRKFGHIENQSEYLEKRENCREEGEVADENVRGFSEDCNRDWLKSLPAAEAGEFEDQVKQFLQSR